MKELENNNFDPEISIEKRQEQESKIERVGQLKPQKGHTVFQYNTKTGAITKAVFEEDLPYAFGKQNKRIIVEDGCIYVSALNLKNAAKKVAKYHGVNLKIK
jgi:hypothetical protein